MKTVGDRMCATRLPKVIAQLRWATLVLAITLVSAGCASTRHVEWTEEVRLSDGQIILVRRTEDYRRVTDVGAGFQTGWLFARARITAPLPSPVAQTVSFESSLCPVALDMAPDKTYYLVGDVATGGTRNEWDVPRHEFHVAFRWTAGAWQRIALAELPLSIQPNLLAYVGYPTERNRIRPGAHVDLKLKEKLIAELPPTDRLRTIIRLKKP